ncbi:uncharacterized protein ACNS7B_004909 [Menidia menidia]
MVLLFVYVVALMLVCGLPGAASLHCNVTRLSDGAFRYQLSDSPPAQSCSTSWEDTDGIVISRDSAFNQSLTVNLTQLYIDLKVCQDHLRYTLECSGIRTETDCRVNCSHFAQKDPPSLSSCFSKDLCFDSLAGGLIIGGIALSLLLVLLICGFCSVRRKRRSAAVLHQEPSEEIPVENVSFLKNPVDHINGTTHQQLV